MTASFVIVNYNRKDELMVTLAETTELIRDYAIKIEIIVVDNGSTDGSAAAVILNFPQVILIAKVDNIGAPAWNYGFEVAQGDYLIIIDDDSHVESGLDKALFYMDENPEIGILALNVVSGPYTSADWKMVENTNMVGFIGCGAIFRKVVYKKIGGYADWMFLYVNEWELGLRCTSAGYKVRFFKECKVVHRTSLINRTSKRLVSFVTKHELAIIYKYFPNKRFKYTLRIILNNFKNINIHGVSLKKNWYTLLGICDFLKMKSSLQYTPVSEQAQKLYIENFPGTRLSPLEFIKNRFRQKNKRKY